MTDLYLDCEFNGNRGSFISLALYNPKGESFYEVSDCYLTLMNYKDEYGGLNEWVKRNVIISLNKPPILHREILAKLQLYLNQFEDLITVYADWPEDFIHLCGFLFVINPNNQIPNKIIPRLRMELITTIDEHKSKIPHNALEDAKALYLNHMEIKNDKTA